VFVAIKQHWGPRVFSWVPIDIWNQLLGVQLILPYYHVVSDQELAHVSGLYKFRSIRQFKADLEFLLRYYIPVSLSDVIHHLDGESGLPKRCFLLSFDDGFREIYDIVSPILYAQGIPAVFFLITSVLDNRELCYPQKKSLLIRALASLEGSPAKRSVEQHLTKLSVHGPDLLTRIRSINYVQKHVLDELGTILEIDFPGYAAQFQPYLTSEQTRYLMRRGFNIGAHSVDHPLYSEVRLDEQLMQTMMSLDILSMRFQFECQAFAFPYNDTGISPEYFNRAFEDGHLKISFGTGGLFRHYFRRNLERFTMEKTDLPAEQILARQFGRTFLINKFR
jgi:peptidoglycan/xylan/chitin deacetylase (PgdA/CDA1 family)